MKLLVLAYNYFRSAFYSCSFNLKNSTVLPRESMRCFPAFLQSPLTLLTGKPLPEEESWQLSPWHHLASACLALGIGTSVAFLLIESCSFWTFGLPLAWLLTVHGARKNRTVIMHQCSHHNFIRVKWFDRFLGKAISILLLSEEFDAYADSHLKNHHSARHQTIDDPTVAFLFFELGLRPGMSPRRMWRNLFLTIISPAYHVRFFGQRLKSHFISTSPRHRLIFLLFWSGLILTVTVFNLWTEFALAWLIPNIPLYQISTAFRLASKHIFLPQLPAKRTKESLGAFTIGIFTGDACPPENLPFLKKLAAWSWWLIRMMFFHLPSGLFMLPGDGCAHDFHHRFPGHPDWSNFIHNREKDAAAAAADGIPYREVWGVHRAIQECFLSLSAANPADYPVTILPKKAIDILGADE